MKRRSYAYPDAGIFIFSKAPAPGVAKTRLIPELGEQGAAAFSARLTRHIVSAIADARLCPLQLWCDPDIDHPLFAELQEKYALELKPQQGESLGARMARAFIAGLSRYRKVLLIGSDCPSVTPDYLEQALACLSRERACVLGPAEDGGYVLVGQSALNTAMFENIDWGTHRVLQQTRERLKSAGCDHVELATRWDVDRPEDIVRARRLMDAAETSLS